LSLVLNTHLCRGCVLYDAHADVHDRDGISFPHAYVHGHARGPDPGYYLDCQPSCSALFRTIFGLKRSTN